MNRSLSLHPASLVLGIVLCAGCFFTMGQSPSSKEDPPQRQNGHYQIVPGQWTAVSQSSRATSTIPETGMILLNTDTGKAWSLAVWSADGKYHHLWDPIEGP